MDVEVAISDCEVCARLEEFETSFEKWGWPEGDRPLAAPAARLVPVEELNSYDKERDHLLRCQACGVYYRFVQTSEYLANGSEERMTLTRLTPTDVSALLSNEDYSRLIVRHLANVRHPHALTRSYSGKCLIAHMLSHGDLDNAKKLLAYTDRDVVEGAVSHLWRLASDRLLPAAAAGLRESLARLASGQDEVIARRAGYTVEHGLPAG